MDAKEAARSLSICKLCPRNCGADRAVFPGACGVGEEVMLARAARHFGEEPCLAGEGGSGAVFFSGCSLGCVFCQNAPISGKDPFGKPVTEERLARIFLELQAEGAETIDLVTAAHFTPAVVCALGRVKDKLNIPVVWNSGGYEKPETLKLLEGLVDIYLPDFKFASPDLAARLCRAPDYPQVAQAAIEEMFRQTGACRFDEDGKLKRGVLVRHLVLPGGKADSLAVLELLKRLFPDPSVIRLSLMRQYTPMPSCPAPALSRRVTGVEYERVLERAAKLGFEGYSQEKESIGTAAIPAFDGTGV